MTLDGRGGEPGGDGPAGVRVVAKGHGWIAVDKPAGLLAVPGRGPDKQDSLTTRVRARWPDAKEVHRLDAATSGIMLIGLEPAAHRSLSAAFRERKVEKRYIAVVLGTLAEDTGEIDLPIGRRWEERPRRRVDESDGKPSLTRWTVLERRPARPPGPGTLGYPETTRLALAPLTGRTHQLRVHLQAIGHPIVGDRLYGGADSAADEGRTLLHAERLVFPDPETGEPIEVEVSPSF